MVIETMQKERLSYSVSDSMDTRLNALSEFQGDRLSASRIFQNPNCPIYRVQFKKTKSPIIIP